VWVGDSCDDVRFFGGDFSTNGTAANDHRGVTVDTSATGVEFVGASAKGNVECGFYATASTRTTFVGCHAEGNNTGFRPGGHGFEILGATNLAACTSKGQLGNAANQGCGYYLAGPAMANGCDAEANYSAGARIYDAANVDWQGGRVFNNSQRLAGAHDGVEVNAATATTDVTVSGVRAYDTQGTKTQRYGISVAGVVVNNYVIQGNNLRGNLTGGLNDLGGANKSVANNLLT
jgi:hypothetical protein